MGWLVLFSFSQLETFPNYFRCIVRMNNLQHLDSERFEHVYDIHGLVEFFMPPFGTHLAGDHYQPHAVHIAMGIPVTRLIDPLPSLPKHTLALGVI